MERVVIWKQYVDIFHISMQVTRCSHVIVCLNINLLMLIVLNKKQPDNFSEILRSTLGCIEWNWIESKYISINRIDKILYQWHHYVEPTLLIVEHVLVSVGPILVIVAPFLIIVGPISVKHLVIKKSPDISDDIYI